MGLAPAETYAADMAAASVLEQRKINLSHQIEVTDEAGHVALTVDFGDVVRIES
jgi:hypothetical protein